MSLGDLLGGKKPTLRVAGPAEMQLGAEATKLEPLRQSLANVGLWHAKGLASGRQGVKRDFLGAANADVQQSFRGPVTSNSQALDNALRRGKGLTRILQSRENDFDSQLLRDRITFASGTASRRGRGLGALAAAAGDQDFLNRNMADANRMRSDSRLNLLGTVAGIGAGFAHNAYRNRDRTPTDIPIAHS